MVEAERNQILMEVSTAPLKGCKDVGENWTIQKDVSDF